jgi:hypothetical protein
MADRLHRDEVDGAIVLVRLPGDRWNVLRSQSDCDWVRNTEVQSPSKKRLGICGIDGKTRFVRVQRIDEERIETAAEIEAGNA